MNEEELKEAFVQYMQDPNTFPPGMVEVADWWLDKLRKVEESVYQKGKAYWEPSEAHKEVWRQEGYQRGKKEVIDRIPDFGYISYPSKIESKFDSMTTEAFKASLI